MKFSIIVPIYNIQEYIKPCVDSITEQSFKNIEIILVNDGSTDNSKAICMEYQNIDDRIKVINKENGGLSSARNAGLKIARGEYIIFLDGDDTLVSECLAKIYNKIKDKDVEMIMCNFRYHNLKTNEYKDSTLSYAAQDINNYKGLQLLEHLLVNNKTTIWAAWRTIINRNFINDNEMLFDESIVGAEDCDWFIKNMIKCKRVYLLNEFLCIYKVNREGSIITNIKFNAIEGQIKVFSKWSKYFFEKNELNMYLYFAKKYCNVLTTVYNLKQEQEKQDLINRIKETKHILSYCTSKKLNLINNLLEYIGINNTCRLLFMVRVFKIKLKKLLEKYNYQ